MPEATETQAPAKAPKALKKFKVVIHSEPEGGDKGDVIIGHNFRLVQIKRNVPVEVDEHILAVLKSSVIDTHVRGEDDKMHPVQIPRYSFTSEAL